MVVLQMDVHMNPMKWISEFHFHAQKRFYKFNQLKMRVRVHETDGSSIFDRVLHCR